MLNPWLMWIRLAVVAAVLVSSFGLGWHIRANIEKVHVAKAQAKILAAERKANDISNQVDDDYVQAYDDLNTKYVAALKRLRSTGSGKKVPASASATDAAACREEFSGQIYEDIGGLMHQADVQTLQLIELQDWVRKQEAVH